MAENSELSEYTRHIPLKKVIVNMPQPVTTCLINMKRDSKFSRAGNFFTIYLESKF